MSTGEVIEFDKAAAERRAERITLRLDSIADNYAAVMPMIREAIEKRDDIALGYNSPTAYVSDRFGGSLQRLGVEVRRSVVKELTEAGMSTRAIAPVVGVSNKTVSQDIRAGVTEVTPDDRIEWASDTAEEMGYVNTETGEVSDDYVTDQTDLDAPFADASSDEIENAFTAAREQGDVPHQGVVNNLPERKVTGLDGKTYTRPEPSKPKRRALPDQARDAGWDLRKSVERLERIAADDRFAANKEQVTPHLRSHLTNAIEVCQDLLDRINN